MGARISLPLPLPVQGVRNDLDYIGDQSALGGRAVPPDALSQAENWIYRDGLFTIRRGTETYGTTPGAVRPMGYAQYQHTDGTVRTVVGHKTGWRKFTAATSVWSDITGSVLTGGDTDQIVFRVFQKGGTSYLVGVNGTDTMKQWNGTAGTYSNAGGTPPRCLGMMIVGNRMIALNLRSGGTIGPTAFDVSSFNDFEAGWGAVLTGLLADTPGDIVAGLEMGSLQGVAYKTDSIYVFTAAAGTVPYQIELKAKGIPGPVSPNAVFALPDGTHVYLALDGTIRRFDGNSVTTVGINDGRNVQRYLSRVAAFSQFNRSFGYYNSKEKEVWFHFAGGAADPNMAIAVKLDTGSVWPMRWATLRFSAGFHGLDLVSGVNNPQVFLGEVGGTQYREQVYVDFATTLMTDNGTRLVTFWQTGMLDPAELGGSQRSSWVTVHELDHIMAGHTTVGGGSVLLTFKVFAEAYGSFGTVGDAGGTVDPRLAGPYITGHRVTGRAFAIRCDSTTDGANIQYRGCVVSIAQRGGR